MLERPDLFLEVYVGWDGVALAAMLVGLLDAAILVRSTGVPKGRLSVKSPGKSRRNSDLGSGGGGGGGHF